MVLLLEILFYFSDDYNIYFNYIFKCKLNAEEKDKNYTLQICLLNIQIFSNLAKKTKINFSLQRTNIF